jgi:hypothetical protein
MKSKELEKKTTQLTTTIHELSVVNRASYELAEDYTKKCIQLEKDIKTFFEPSKKSAHDTHKKIIEMEKEQLAPVGKLKAYLKAEMTGYIRLEEAYNDAIHAYIKAVTIGEEAVQVVDSEDIRAILDHAREQSKKGRAEVDPQPFLDDAIETLSEMEGLAPLEVEVKKAKTNLRKLSLKHEIVGVDMAKLVLAMKDWKVPPYWLKLDESAVLRDIKDLESQEDLVQKYGECGIIIEVERSLR